MERTCDVNAAVAAVRDDERARQQADDRRRHGQVVLQERRRVARRLARRAGFVSVPAPVAAIAGGVVTAAFLWGADLLYRQLVGPLTGGAPTNEAMLLSVGAALLAGGLVVAAVLAMATPIGPAVQAHQAAVRMLASGCGEQATLELLVRVRADRSLPVHSVVDHMIGEMPERT